MTLRFASAPPRPQRGIALISVLLAITVIVAVLAVMFDVGMSSLRRAAEQMRALQAQAGADAGAGYFRGLLAQNKGDLQATLAAVRQADGGTALQIDDETSVKIKLSVQLPAPSAQSNHIDYALQRNAGIAETPLQVTSTATVTVNGTAVSSRTQTTLLRTFRTPAPYSEIVGVIDGGGPVGTLSPGDAGGQAGDRDATDLRLHVYRQGTSGLTSADEFEDERWSDDNVGAGGALP